MISHGGRIGLSLGGLRGLRLNRIGGQITYSQLPSGSGSWDTGAGTTITITRGLTVSGLLTASARAAISGGVEVVSAISGGSASNPGLSKSGTTLLFRLADNSAYCNVQGQDATFNAGTFAAVLTASSGQTLGAPIRLKGYTVGTLPAGTQGDTAYVTDALAPAFLTALVGGGAVVTPSFYDGTNWIAI